MSDSKSMRELAKQLKEAGSQLESEAQNLEVVEAAEFVEDLPTLLQTDFRWVLTPMQGEMQLKAVPTTDQAQKFVAFLTSCEKGEVWKMVHDVTGHKPGFYRTTSMSESRYLYFKLPNLSTVFEKGALTSVLEQFPDFKVEIGTACYEAFEQKYESFVQYRVEEEQTLLERQQKWDEQRATIKQWYLQAVPSDEAPVACDEVDWKAVKNGEQPAPAKILIGIDTLREGIIIYTSPYLHLGSGHYWSWQDTSLAAAKATASNQDYVAIYRHKGDGVAELLWNLADDATEEAISTE